jgi:hypothetical protein
MNVIRIQAGDEGVAFILRRKNKCRYGRARDGERRLARAGEQPQAQRQNGCYGSRRVAAAGFPPEADEDPGGQRCRKQDRQDGRGRLREQAADATAKSQQREGANARNPISRFLSAQMPAALDADHQARRKRGGRHQR